MTATCSPTQRFFARFAEKSADAAGTPAAFFIAFLLVLIWAATGPYFHYSEVWQIVINTATTIITFLLVFLIQNSQNRETRALQIKLDELIFASQGAKNTMLGIEKLSDAELRELCVNYEKLAEKARKQLAKEEGDSRATPAENKQKTEH